MSYSEFRFYSPLRDCDVIRISMTDGKGEFFAFVPVVEGKSYRAQREAALDLIQSAIDAKLEPGEVVAVSPACR